MLVLIIAVGVLVLGGGIALVVSRGRRDLPPPSVLEAITEEEIEHPEHPEPHLEDEADGGSTATTTIERPEAAQGRLVRLRARLARSQGSLGKGLLAVLGRADLDDAAWEELEDTLLAADVGVGPTTELVDALRTRVRVEGIDDPERAKAALRDELVRLVGTDLDRTLSATGSDGKPGVVLVVGVNGTGKTTTVGRLARVLVADGKTVVLGAADTFRAAAADQLQTWGERVGVDTVRGPEGGDPASVGFESVQRGIADGTDVVLVDTAGRLHTKAGLMDELGKVKRVIEKQAPVTEVLLVIDATTGQNGLTQASVFAEVVDVTGIVLTKLDGTAKGGIVDRRPARARRAGEVRGPRRGRRRPRSVRRRGVRGRSARVTTRVIDDPHQVSIRRTPLA